MRKRIRSLLIVFGALAIFGVVLWGAMPRERPLLPQAALVSPQGIAYCWLNNHELLRTTLEKNRGVLHRRDVSTGMETAPEALKQCDATITNLMPSPDGKYLLWDEQGEEGATYGLAVADGSRYTRLKEMNATHWAPDSRHWIQFKTDKEGDSVAVLRNIEAPKELQTLDIDAPDNNDNDSFYSATLTPDSRLLVRQNDCYQEGGSIVQIHEYTVGKSIQHVGIHKFTLPKGALLENWMTDVKESPQGTLALLRVETQETTTWVYKLARHLPFLKAPSLNRVELWVGDLKSGNLHTLGFVPGEARQPAATQSALALFPPRIVDNLAWTPDGKRVSFTYKENIYTVPVE